MFTQGWTYDAAKYEDYVEVIINYVQREYSVGVYLGQEIRDGKVTDLEMLNSLNKNENKSEAEFDKEVFEWKDNAKTVFGRRQKTKEGNKKLYSLFID